MCIICFYYINGKLTAEEGLQNINEMFDVVGEEHSKDVMSFILNEEMDDIMDGFDVEIDNLWPT